MIRSVTRVNTNEKAVQQIEVEVEEKVEEELKDYSKLTNKELREILDEKNIEYSKSDTKSELLDALEGDK